jgi:gliding motility-associated lipoprotein GldD
LQAIFNKPATDLVIQFVAILILLVIAAFLAASELALFSLSPDEINEVKEGEKIKDRLIRKLLDRPQQTRHAILIVRTAIRITVIFIGIYGIRCWMFQSVDSGILYVLVAACFFFLFWIFDGILPDYLVQNNLVRIGQHAPLDSKDPDEQEMLEDILHFYHKTADEIMIPRLDMTAVDMTCELNELVELVIKTGFSRIPVYEETEDHIRGILYVKDLLPAIQNPDSFQWRKLIRPAYFVPETKKIDDLLEEFQTHKIHIAIVVDEFGCTSGLVTIEDVIEEIVGEISDEYDSDEQHFLQLPDGSYIFEGKIQLNDFFRRTAIDASEFGKITEEADTLAGLLLQIKGTLPKCRDVIDYRQYRFRVLEADARRVLKVKFSRMEQTPKKKTGVTGILGIILLIFGAVSCTNSASVATPKPRGFYRIELPQAHYVNLPLDDVPYSFMVDHLVTVELPPIETSDDWINLAYSTLNAKIYCNYQQITPAVLPVLEEECRELVARNARRADAVSEQTYENRQTRVYGTLFRIDGETVSPVRFILTDSATHFFRGAIYYECKPNVDSLAPVTQYLTENVLELIQSFHWKHVRK